MNILEWMDRQLDRLWPQVGRVPQDPSLHIYASDKGILIPLVPVYDDGNRRIVRWTQDPNFLAAKAAMASQPPSLPAVPCAPTAGQPQFNPAAAVGL
jgi:hypothetical protein